MSGPKWTNVKYPSGAIMRNAPLLVGVIFSVIIVVGLFFSAESPEEEPQGPLGLVEQLDVDPGEEYSPDRLTTPLRVAARQAAAEAARREREQAQDVRREQALADARTREAQAEFRRVREELERYRARQAAGQDVRFPPNLANSDTEVLRQTFEMERLESENAAYGAPLVVSSARSFSGGRRHSVSQFPPRSYRPPLNPAGSVSGGVAAVSVPPVTGSGMPAAPRPVAPAQVPPVSVPPAASGMGAPQPGVAPVQTHVGSGLAQGLGPPIGRPGRGTPGTFDFGPGAQGQGGTPPEVVVTPNDGIHDRVYEGTFVPAVLQTQIQGDFSGPVSSQVTRSVYSRDRQRIVIPRGTIVLGTASGAEGPFQERLAVGFHRMIFPDGRWIMLEGPNSLWGLSAMGESSLKDQVDRHYLQAFGSAGAIGLLAALSQGQGGQGGYGVQDAMSQNAAQMGLQLMSRFLNRRPTVTIRAGHRLNIRFMTDVIIPREVSRDVG